jgi:hypothetical protein
MCVNKTDRNIYYILQENFEDTKEQNGRNTENTLTKKNKRDKRTNNDLQKTTEKTTKY